MAALTTLERVKEYLAITSPGSDVNIAKLIPRESTFVERWCGRQFSLITRNTKRLNGTGTAMMVLPDAPIIAVTQVAFAGANLPASSIPGVAGYSNDDTCVYLEGSVFPYARQAVTISWTAGYQAQADDVIPTGNTPTLSPSVGGMPVSDQGVVNTSTGAALTSVANAPAAGQYAFNASAGGTYQFNTADANTPVTMTYCFVPGPVEQAVIELVGIDLKQRDNLGIKSKNLGNESIVYEDRAMPPSAREMLQPYRRMEPV